MTDVVGWGSKAGGQNRSNDDLMMGGRNFARGVFGDDTFLSPPLGATDWPGWFWTKRCHTSFSLVLYGACGL